MVQTYAYLIREPDWDSDRFLPGSPGADPDSDEGFAAHAAFVRALEELDARIVGGHALQHASYGGLTRPGPAGHEVEQAVHTDSAYVDSSEVITGFYLIEVADEETARRISAMVPTSGTVEWRKVFPSA